MPIGRITEYLYLIATIVLYCCFGYLIYTGADRQSILIAFLFAALFSTKHDVIVLNRKLKEIERRLGIYND